MVATNEVVSFIQAMLNCEYLSIHLPAVFHQLLHIGLAGVWDWWAL